MGELSRKRKSHELERGREYGDAAQILRIVSTGA